MVRLLDCFADVVAYVAYLLKNVEKKQPAFEKVESDIHRLLSQSEDWVQKGHVSREDFDQARFAICAWIDESLLSAPWQGKSQWMREQLQRVYFQTTDAGEEFFERLNSLGPQQSEIREVYYLCLAMGFAGRYCNEGDEYLLEQLKKSNLKMLTGSSVGLPSLEREELFPGAYPVTNQDESVTQKQKFRFSRFTLACLVSPIALFLALFLIYRFVLAGMGENLLSRIP